MRKANERLGCIVCTVHEVIIRLTVYAPTQWILFNTNIFNFVKMRENFHILCVHKSSSIRSLHSPKIFYNIT